LDHKFSNGPSSNAVKIIFHWLARLRSLSRSVPTVASGVSDLGEINETDP
jgi:hypothetical protein